MPSSKHLTTPGRARTPIASTPETPPCTEGLADVSRSRWGALLDAGADVAARDLQGRTPLHHVTLGDRRGDVARAVLLLLASRADPEVLDGNGETVMTLARRRRDVVTVRALIDTGVGAGTKCTNGRDWGDHESHVPVITCDAANFLLARASPGARSIL